MTDAELAVYLNLTPAEAAIVIPQVSPEKRALYDRMRELEVEVALWDAGLGPKPQGVLIDTERPLKAKISRAFLKESGFRDNLDD